MQLTPKTLRSLKLKKDLMDPQSNVIAGSKYVSEFLARMNGQPCIRDLRLTVRRVVELTAIYPVRAELQKEFPELQDEDIRQALHYAANCLDDRIIELPMNYETVA